ncbi:MAG: ABC transporter substrate-binding protein [Actinobacteria bacterium]|nr:ABC transporter substrate-binding protein [Actinomycetota bacterium]
MTERAKGESTDALGLHTRRQIVQRGLVSGAALSLPGLLAACGGSSGPGSRPAGGGTPRRGGTLRVGITGGGTKETLNPGLANSDVDVARVAQVYEGFVTYDAKGNVVHALLDEATPNKDATVWTLRLNRGVEFHDGRVLSADDAIYSLRYTLDPKNASLGAGQISNVKPDSIRKIDDLTLRLELNSPNSYFDATLVDYHLRIFPEGTTTQDLARRPIGTGPFQFVEWTPGERASYKRFENYRIPDRPYVDRLEVVSITDDDARVNALLSGQVDAIASLALPRVPEVERNGAFQVVEGKSTANFIAQYMWTSGAGAKPFDDVRVRQAFRLLVDRQQIVDNALSGHARVANDMTSPSDPSYPKDLPQRQYDPEQARSLLKAAGYDGLRVDLWTADVNPGVAQFATLMANSAKEAGVTIRVRKQPADQYFATAWGRYPFASTYWGGRTYPNQCAAGFVPGAGLNETRWRDEQWLRLYREALATVDRTKANEILTETQKILHERGGYIIPVFPNVVDAASAKVGGLEPGVLDHFVYWDFRNVYVQA